MRYLFPRWALLTLVLVTGAAFAASTEFTYQGQLKDANGPCAGTFDFTFALFDASSGGAQTGTTLTKSGVTVTGGLFTVALDFGTSVFTGADRWLEISVKAASAGTYSPLAARQKLTATPYALYSISAGTAAPSGPAGGDLTGTYPNPTVAQLGPISGANLTDLNASNFGSGTVPNVRLNIGTAANQLVALDGSAKLPAVDGSQLTNLSAGSGMVPIGGVVAWLKSYTNTPALPAQFVECNGQTLSDAASPYNGQTIPNLNASGGGSQRFLRGATTSGATGGLDSATTSAPSATSPTFQNAGGTQAASTTHTHTVNVLPSYYEVVWVMRVK